MELLFAISALIIVSIESEGKKTTKTKVIIVIAATVMMLAITYLYAKSKVYELRRKHGG